MPKKIEYPINNTMKKHIENFLNYLLSAENKSMNTVRAYKTDLEYFVHTMGINDVNEITRESAYNFLAILKTNGKDATYRNRKLASIRSFCQYLDNWKKISINPVSNIKHAKTERKLPNVLTVEQTMNIVNAASNNIRDLLSLMLLYGCGIRIDELVTMLVEKINFEEGTVMVKGKGEKWRVVPITKKTEDVLKDYLNNREFESNYVFPSTVKDDAHITTRAMYNAIVKYGKKVGIKFHPHDFRHATATHLLSKGWDIRKIQELLGHANLNTTSIYADVVKTQMVSEIRSLHPMG